MTAQHDTSCYRGYYTLGFERHYLTGDCVCGMAPTTISEAEKKMKVDESTPTKRHPRCTCTELAVCDFHFKLGNVPPSAIRDAIDELTLTLALKNSDYKIDGEFSNFEFAANVVGGGCSPELVMLTQIGIKLGRLQGSTSGHEDYNFESVKDTVKDLAGYAVIMYAYYLSKENDRG